MIARADNAARDLLARLTDEAELESAAIGDVRADLALLGVDPARAIRFSRALAENAASPAGGLLAKALAADDSDREVSALELADAHAVRAELTAAAPLAMAHAGRLSNKAAGHASRRRPSRRLWYGIGGTITALAASVLIVINVWDTAQVSPQAAFTHDGSGPVMPPGWEAQSRSSDALAFDPQSQPSPPSSPTPARTGTQPAGLTSNSSETCATCMALDTAEAEKLAEQQIARLSQGALSGLAPVTESGARDLIVTAALILQPDLAPEPLRQSDLGAGDLQALLPDAARSRLSKSVVALVTLQHPDGTTVDAMLLRPRLSQYMRESSGDLPGQDGEALVFSEPAGTAPTLGQLLAEDAGDFFLGKIKSPASAEQN